MTQSGRADVASSFTLIKGAMIEETYAVFSAWDFDRSKRENLDRLRHDNFIGARSATWLRDIAKVLNRRFDPEGRDRALVILAKGGCALDVWKPILLWHTTRDEFLLRDFLINWLYPAYQQGVFRIRHQSLHAYLRTIAERGGRVEHSWTAATTDRVAVGLLGIAAEFGLLKGGTAKEFASYHLPEQSFLYLLHALLDALGAPRKVLESLDWQMFLMSRADVERELLRLHQFRKLRYELAGSLVQLTLPYPSTMAFAQGMVA